MKDKDGLESTPVSSIRSAVVASNINLEKTTKLINLFTTSDNVYSPEQLTLFDDILEPLIVGLENAALEILSQNIAQTTQAPPKLLQRFALDESAPIAGPVLTHHPSIPENILIKVAKTRSDAHLRYLSKRKDLPFSITTPLIKRGSRSVLSNIIENESAEFSTDGLDTLIEKSAPIEELAEKLAARPDIPYSVITRLVSLASDKVKVKLRKQLAARNLEVDAVLDSASQILQAKTYMKSLDLHSAKKRALAIKVGNRLSKQELAHMIKHKDMDGAIIVLGNMAGISCEFVVKMMLDPQPLSVLALLRCTDSSWNLVTDFMSLREEEIGLTWDIEMGQRIFDKLDIKLAQSIVDGKRYVTARKMN